MKSKALNKVKNKVEEFFPLKTFILSFAFLLLALLSYIGIHQAFFKKADESMKLSGKIMAEIQIEDSNLEPVIEPPAPEPVVEKIEAPTEETPEINPDAPLEVVDPEAIPNPRDQMASETIALEDSIPGLSEETPFGSLPIVRSSDGLKSFDAYKTPFIAKATTKGVISLVMVDFGLSDTSSKLMIESLPISVTLIASPYAENLQSKISAARGKSFEIWMNIPMQGDSVNMGQNTILSGLNSKENLFRLNTHLGKATGYAGITIDALSKFPEASQDLQRLMDSISTRGLGIAQLEPDDKMIGLSAVIASAPFIQSTLWIDNMLTKQNVLNELSRIEKISLENGIAVAAFRPSPLTTSIIQDWQKSLESKNIQLAPLSYSAKMNLSAPAATVKKDESN